MVLTERSSERIQEIGSRISSLADNLQQDWTVKDNADGEVTSIAYDIECFIRDIDIETPADSESD